MSAFSSRMIPGNERAIGTVQDNLVRRGVHLMTDSDHLVHVSGHPARDELRRLYKLVKPKYAVPVNGEWRHLSAHAALAKDAGSTPFLMEDGDILGLAPGRPEIIDSAPVGRLVLDGSRLVPLKGEVMAARRRMLFNGVVVGSVAFDEGVDLLERHGRSCLRLIASISRVTSPLRANASPSGLPARAPFSTFFFRSSYSP